MADNGLLWEQFKVDLSLLLSCQRNVDDLNQALAHVLDELLADIPYRLYLNKNANLSQDFALYSSNCESPSVESDLQRMRELDVMQPLERDEDCIFFPALMADNLFAYVVTESNMHDELPVQLMCILAVYCNVHLLISDSKNDGLTGLANRKTFDSDLLKELTAISKHRRKQDEVNSYLALIDVDHFKKVNDEHGHLIGDEVLLKLSQLLNECFREYDGLYRYGGEEFAVLLRNILPDEANTVLARLLGTVRNTEFPTVSNLTVSIGFTLLEQHTSPHQAIEQADRALYYSKDNGRDQSSNFNELLSDGVLFEDNIETDIELF